LTFGPIGGEWVVLYGSVRIGTVWARLESGSTVTLSLASSAWELRPSVSAAAESLSSGRPERS
jgi:hypothetical protein